MPQPRSRRKTTSAAKPKASSGSRAKSSSTAGAKAGAKGGAAAKRKAPAKRKPASRRRPAARQTSAEKSVAAFRDALEQSVIAPRNIVLISSERMQEVLDDAVRRGRMTRNDAETTLRSLLRRGRKETEDILSNLERLVDDTRSDVGKRVDKVTERSRKRVEKVTARGRKRAVEVADPALRQTDKVRRQAGIGAAFPITAYDDLSASQIGTRLTDLTPAELRKVRDYEKRNKSRKSILDRVQKQLAK